MDLKERVKSEFRERFGRHPQLVVRAPGRVNLLGEHVDYNEGWVLPLATEHAVWLAAAPAESDQVTVKAVDFDGQEVSFSARELKERDQSKEVSWADYPRGVAWSLQCQQHDVTPMDAVFSGNVPVGAGVSSSAAVEVAFLTAWNELADLGLSGVQVAELGQLTENAYIGLASGVMDQFASVHGAVDHLVLLDCRTLEHELVPLPPDSSILVADSGVRRALASSEYNVRRRQCEEAVAILQRYLPGIQSLRDVSPVDFERYGNHLPIVLRRRAQHVIDECQRVLAGVECLKKGDIESFGQLLRRSHESLRDLYEVSIPELDLLAATAWRVQGCYGARLTGAGFGGCIVVLVEVAAEARIVKELRQAYEAAYDRTPSIFSTRAAEGARALAP